MNNDSNTWTFSTKAHSVNRALDQIGDRWCLLILQHILRGTNTFNKILKSTGISKSVLVNRLDWLIEIDCLIKIAKAGNSSRPKYALTDKSKDLYDTGLMAYAWENKYSDDSQSKQISLYHHQCNNSFKPIMECKACDKKVQFDDVFYHQNPNAGIDERINKDRRRSSKPVRKSADDLQLNKTLIEIIGDRWSASVISHAFHQVRRFENFKEVIGLAPNILTNRLELLIDGGILFRQPYQTNPVRYEYHLSKKGRDLYPLFLCLLRWGDRWCQNDKAPPMTVFHAPCRNDLESEVRCSQCKQALHLKQVSIKI